MNRKLYLIPILGITLLAAPLRAETDVKETTKADTTGMGTPGAKAASPEPARARTQRSELGTTGTFFLKYDQVESGIKSLEGSNANPAEIEAAYKDGEEARGINAFENEKGSKALADLLRREHPEIFARVAQAVKAKSKPVSESMTSLSKPDPAADLVAATKAMDWLKKHDRAAYRQLQTHRMIHEAQRAANLEDTELGKMRGLPLDEIRRVRTAVATGANPPAEIAKFHSGKLSKEALIFFHENYPLMIKGYLRPHELVTATLNVQLREMNGQTSKNDN